tara:strand:+ start:166 stop:471 length:306 start_codon:yes stop_codon:yes gene_type:complete
MKSKKGMQLAISTLILLILGIIVLIGLVTVLVMGWGDFKTQIKMFLGSETASAQKQCKIQCGLDNNYDYCCEDKEIDGVGSTCQSEILKTECVLDCSAVTC